MPYTFFFKTKLLGRFWRWACAHQCFKLFKSRIKYRVYRVIYTTFEKALHTHSHIQSLFTMTDIKIWVMWMQQLVYKNKNRSTKRVCSSNIFPLRCFSYSMCEKSFFFTLRWESRQRFTSQREEKTGEITGCLECQGLIYAYVLYKSCQPWSVNGQYRLINYSLTVNRMNA